jgi:hypothetical protein
MSCQVPPFGGGHISMFHGFRLSASNAVITAAGEAECVGRKAGSPPGQVGDSVAESSTPALVEQQMLGKQE